jgi:DNA-binding transcriptional ArsR family regulator
VIRDLLTGGKRFNDLVDRLGGITPKTLSQRLRELEDAGLVTADREAGQPPQAEHLLGAVTGPSNSPPATPAQPAGTSVSTVRTTWSKATVAGGRAPRVLRLLLPGCSSRGPRHRDHSSAGRLHLCRVGGRCRHRRRGGASPAIPSADRCRGRRAEPLQLLLLPGLCQVSDAHDAPVRGPSPVSTSQC